MAYTGSKAQAGRGATLSIGATPGVLIGEITDLPFDLPEWQTVDTTNLQSGSDSEFLPTIRKTSAWTLKVNRVSTDAGQAAVQTAYSAATLTPFSLTLPAEQGQTTGDSFTFNAYVLSASFTISPTSVVSASLKIQISGPVTPVEGTAAA